MKYVMDCLYVLAALGLCPVVLYRILRHNRYRAGWAERLGKISRDHPQKKCIWIHAVSVGEVNATKTIIKELEKKFGDYEIVLSTTTDTGFTCAEALFADRIKVFYFPFDLSPAMARAFGNIKPAICLLMELEVWPNFVAIANEKNVPVVVVNGRISDSSFSRYRTIKPVIKKVFEKVSLILAQTAEYAVRFVAIGVPQEKVFVTGSLKYDTAETTTPVAGADELAARLQLGREKLWVAGATGNDEEKIILDAYEELKKQGQFADLRLVVVPRKPERFDEVAELIKQRGLALVRYSEIKDKPPPFEIDKNAVIFGDTMGDLRKFYSLATIIFVGRSLVPMGGSDMMEAAALGKCTMFGPHAFNFKQAVDALLQGRGAIMVKDKNDLADKMQKCLSDTDYAEKIAEKGREVIKKNQGATQRTIEKIAGFLC